MSNIHSRIGILTLVLLTWTIPAFSEPHSPSCAIAIEKIFKARKNLIPYQRTLELARSREHLAYADLAVCAGGGVFSVGRAIACSDASWIAPQRTKDVLVAEDDYLQAKDDFEKYFSQAEETCLSEP